MIGRRGSPRICSRYPHGWAVAFFAPTALNSSLSSCAPGVTVVNIDNGYGAAFCFSLPIEALAA